MTHGSWREPSDPVPPGRPRPVPPGGDGGRARVRLRDDEAAARPRPRPSSARDRSIRSSAGWSARVSSRRTAPRATAGRRGSTTHVAGGRRALTAGVSEWRAARDAVDAVLGPVETEGQPHERFRRAVPARVAAPARPRSDRERDGRRPGRPTSTEAAAEGASPEVVLGTGAFDAPSFAASWAAARGFVEPPPARRRPSPLLIGVFVSVLLAVVGFALFSVAPAPRWHREGRPPTGRSCSTRLGTTVPEIGVILVLVGIAGVLLDTRVLVALGRPDPPAPPRPLDSARARSRQTARRLLRAARRRGSLRPTRRRCCASTRRSPPPRCSRASASSTSARSGAGSRRVSGWTSRTPAST